MELSKTRRTIVIIRVYWKSIICHENQPIAKEID